MMKNNKKLMLFLILLGVFWSFTTKAQFVTTWVPVSAAGGPEITIPTNATSGPYNYTISWVNLTGTGSGTISGLTGDYTITGLNAGDTYEITITGTFPHFYMSETYDLNNSGQLRTIEQWGNNAWISMNYAFTGAIFLTYNATDLPNLSNVTDMEGMFQTCISLDGNSTMNNWDVSNVTNMRRMFNDCNFFNQNLGNWDVSNVTNMEEMFATSSSFNQDLGNWDVSNVTNMASMLGNTALSVANYDATLIGWTSLPSLQTNVSLGSGGLIYCTAELDRQNILINTYGWNITGDTKDPSCGGDFITRWQIGADGEILIPTAAGAYNYTVSWVNLSTLATGSMSGLTGNYTISGLVPGDTYEVSISGDFPHFYMNNNATGDNRNELISIEQWGSIAWSNMTNAFYGCANLTYNASDAPDLSNVIYLDGMFWNCTSLNGNSTMDNWDVSNVGTMYRMFRNATSFNQDLNNWDMSNVSRTQEMFYQASAFNGAIDQWDVSNLENVRSMFRQATSFNQPIGNWGTTTGNFIAMEHMFDGALIFNQDLDSWDVSKVKYMDFVFHNAREFNGIIGQWDVGEVLTMYGMFKSAYKFNQDLNNWDVSKVSRTEQMFNNAYAFNGAIDQWDVSNVQNMRSMFRQARSFNQPIGNWGIKTGNVIVMEYMFDGAIVFNQDLNSWDVSKVMHMDVMFRAAYVFNGAIDQWDVGEVKSMAHMFNYAYAFNQNLNSWDVSKVTTMYRMFERANSFNGAIDLWNVSNVTNMYVMFGHAYDFNQDISGWDVGKVTNMAYMFDANHNFNQNLNSWDVSKVTNMTAMFRGAHVFNGAIDLWDVGEVTNMSYMFNYAYAFNQDISGWDVSKVTNMAWMFRSANDFDQNLSSWGIENVTNMAWMLSYSGLSRANYDATLIGWAGKSVQSNVSLGARNLIYCSGSTAHSTLETTYSWNIIEDTEYCGPSMNPGPSDEIIEENPTTATSVAEVTADTPTAEALSEDFQTTELLAPYPNPTIAITRIPYTVAHEGLVSITIQDMQGRQVATVISEANHEAGNFEGLWDTQSVSAGTYICTLQADGLIQSYRIIVE